MKKVEIKEVGIVSALKTTLYIVLIPMALILVIGIIMLSIGISTGESTLTIIGISYVVMPIFLATIYGVISMLISLIYNKLAKRFGGLEIVIKEKNENQYGNNEVQ